MKRICCTGALGLSLLLGAARTVDLLLNTDAETGFLLSGSIMPRYLLMLACVLLILLAGHFIPLGQSCGLRPEDTGWMRGGNFLLIPLAFCCELYGFLFLLNRLFGVSIQMSSGHHAMDDLRLYYVRQFADGARAALFVLFGIWCLLLFFENLTRIPYGEWMSVFGVLSSVVFYLHTTMRFIERPSSVHRIVRVVDILSALAALLFVTALLRALYLSASLQAARTLCRGGLLAFFFCTCLALPQAVWAYAKGTEPLVSLILAFGTGCLGLIGAVCAWLAANAEEAEEV